MENREQEIISKSAILFRKDGFKHVTMDDIAMNLGMSKKTLYKYFTNKRELIARIIRLYIDSEKSHFREFGESATDAIGEMVQVIRHVLQMFDEMDISIFEDLKKYYPKSWVDMDSFLTDHIYKRISQNIERGMEEGLYRKNMNSDIIAKMYVVKVRGIMEEKLFPKKHYDKKTVMKAMVEYHIRGIVNEKGLFVLNDYISTGI